MGGCKHAMDELTSIWRYSVLGEIVEVVQSGTFAVGAFVIWFFFLYSQCREMSIC